MLIIDSGLSVHRQLILDQLAAVGADEATVTFLPFHYGELNSNCNFAAIAARFGVDRIIGDFFGPPHQWLDFMPDADFSDALAKAQVISFPNNGSITLNPGSLRQLETFLAPIWLLPYSWAYDKKSGTLFTCDMFSWVSQATMDGPWVIETPDEEQNADRVYNALCRNTYWWLPGANVARMREQLAETFQRLDVETIAPGWGCVLHGREIVKFHVDLLDQALARAAQAEPHGVSAGQWSNKAGAAK